MYYVIYAKRTGKGAGITAFLVERVGVLSARPKLDSRHAPRFHTAKLIS